MLTDYAVRLTTSGMAIILGHTKCLHRSTSNAIQIVVL